MPHRPKAPFHQLTSVVVVAALLSFVGGRPLARAAALSCDGRTGLVILEEDRDPPWYRPGASLDDDTTVDATAMDWRVPAEGYLHDPGAPDGARTDYAVYLGQRSSASSEGVCLLGGSIRQGRPHETTTWSTWHETNAPLIVTAPRAEIVGTRIFNTGDAIRFAMSTAEDWTVRGVHIRQAHDDCIENDLLHSGTIEDSFLDGCFTAISAKATRGAIGSGVDGTGERIIIRDSLIRLQPMPHVYRPGEFVAPGHTVLFKFQAGWEYHGHEVGGRSPQLEVRDTVIVLEQYPSIRQSAVRHGRPLRRDLLPRYDPNRERGGPLPPEPYLRPDDCSDNTVVWLGEGEPDLGHLPPCFEVLTGAEAREFWEERRSAWLDDHPLAWQRDSDPEVFDHEELPDPSPRTGPLPEPWP